MKRLVGLALLALGVVVLLRNLGIVDVDWAWGIEWEKYLWPFVLVFVGCSLAFGGKGRKDNVCCSNKMPGGENGNVATVSVCFSGNRYDLSGEKFGGAKIDVFCGGVEIDLRGAIIDKDVEIDVNACMGGATIFVDKGVNIQMDNRCFLGGVDNKAKSIDVNGGRTLLLKASCFFGGVDIRN